MIDHSTLPRDPSLSVFLAAVIAAGVTTAGSDAHAQFVHRLRFHGELGAGTMLSDHARRNLGYDTVGGELTLRVGVRLVGPLQAQVGIANWLWFQGRDGPNGRLLTLELGLRGAFAIGRAGELWADLNAGPGFSDVFVRVHGNVGAGFDFAVSRTVALGPFARYGRYFQTSETTRSNAGNEDAQFWAAGLQVTVRVPEPPPPPPPPVVRDTDGDGVLDPNDRCVAVPQGPHPDPTRIGCPTPDRDGDGVLDPQDVCPDEPPGATPDPERIGCPDGDRDGDGLSDHNDRCPDEAMAPRPDPERPGCRRPETVTTLGMITFERGASTIPETAPNLEALNQARVLFSSHPEVERFAVEGHTDPREGQRYNLRLSQARAESVRDWLASHGINTERMVPAGYGESCPADPANTEEAWARNRRVVFVIARRSGAPEPGVRFGCARGERYIPAALGGRGETTETHGRGHHRRSDR